MIDKLATLQYNNKCVNRRDNIIKKITWRNTQEAEEAPLLRV